jgi:hypothetical protein
MEVEKADASAEQRRKIDAGKYEMKYRDLKESFRLYRKKAKEIFEAQQRGRYWGTSHQVNISRVPCNIRFFDWH